MYFLCANNKKEENIQIIKQTEYIFKTIQNSASKLTTKEVEDLSNKNYLKIRGHNEMKTYN